MRTTNQKEENRVDSERPKRVPINGLRDKLTVKGIPEDLHACWVNDYNVDRFKEAGYSFWNGSAVVGDNHVDGNSGLTSGVISKNVGNDVTAYVMVIPVEIYEQDKKELEQEVAAKESILFRSQKQAEGRYGNIEVQHGGKVA